MTVWPSAKPVEGLAVREGSGTFLKVMGVVAWMLLLSSEKAARTQAPGVAQSMTVASGSMSLLTGTVVVKAPEASVWTALSEPLKSHSKFVDGT